MARVEINENDMEQVVGGAFNFYSDSNGSRFCNVDDVGVYSATSSAQQRLISLMIEHKMDGWTAADYVQVLINEGQFTPV